MKNVALLSILKDGQPISYSLDQKLQSQRSTL